MKHNNNQNLNLKIKSTQPSIIGESGLVSPVRSYKNAKLMKDIIKKENSNKSGIYR